MSSEAASPATDPPPDRVLSIDALRGLDMLMIIGFDRLIEVVARRWPNPTTAALATQFEHVEWEGFRFYDLIFPLFLFLVGAVLPYSLGKLRERGAERSSLYGRVLRRTLLLFALGLIFNDILQFKDGLFTQFRGPTRLTGVLQRIAVCYGLAGLIYLNTNRLARALAFTAILVGYWALLANVAPPGGRAGDFSKEGNLAGWVDRHDLPGRVVDEYYGYGDNEGLLSTLPALATTLLGALAGDWLRSSRAGAAKVVGLLLAGSASLFLGTYWGRTFPIIKNLWTSSFVLVAGGWSLLLLAAFYLIIDVLKLRRWAFPFVVIGTNAITIYSLRRFINFDQIARFFLGGLMLHAGDANGPVILAIGVLLAEWLFLYFLYRHRIFLRV